jgi:transposase
MKGIKIPPIAERETLGKASTEKLVELVLRQQEVISQLVEEIDRLKVIVGSDSQTSSKPPSSDIHKRSEKSKEPAEPETEAGDKTKRIPGGQPGHAGKTRRGFGRVDRYEVLRPTVCAACGQVGFSTAPVSIRQQAVAELAAHPIEVVVYEQHRCSCEHCGVIVAAAMPPGVIAGQSLGASLQGLLVWLGNYGHLSYEKQQEFLAELGHIDVGIGTLQQTNVRLSERVKTSVLALGEWVKQQPQVQVDESPWLIKGVKEWMWVACGDGFCLFHAADTRARTELETLLGQHFAGVLVSDDFSVYNGYPVSAQQKCLAHLRRHFKKVIKLNHGNNPLLGKVFIDLIDAAFRAHRQWRETQDASAYRTWASAFKIELQSALQTWLSKAGYAAGLLLRSLRDKAQQWWYFLDHPQVPPDNNRSERSLRLAVTKRKVCGGSRSMNGFAQTATLLTVIQTCRAQGRSALDFFRRSLITRPSDVNQLIPSLIPCSPT